MKSYILLDRSGSMSSNWDETIGALNHYAKTVGKDKPKTKITVAAFDSGGFEVVRDKQAAGDWEDINPRDITPRSMTPLLDAIGKLDALVSGKRVAICILTDGAENSSRELTKDAAKKIVESWKSKGYDVVFIGADFDAFGDANRIGVHMGQTINVSKGKMGETMAAYAVRTSEYTDTGDASKGWTDKQRKDLA